MEFFHELRYFFSVFAGGITPVRPYLFIVWTLILFISPSLYRFPENISSFVRQGTIFVLSALFVIGALLHGGIFYMHDIPLAQGGVFFDSSEITSSTFSHNHLGKVVVGTSLGFLPHLVAVTDTGKALTHFVSLWQIFLLGILFITLIVLSIISYQFLRLQENGEKNKRYIYLTLYSLVSFICITKVIDGGILSEHALLAATLFIALLLKTKKISLYILSGSILSLVLVFVFVEMHSISPLQGGYAVLRIVVFGLVSLLLWQGTRRIRMSAVFIIGAIAVAMIGSLVLSSYERNYRAISITPETVWLTSAFKVGEDFAEIGKIGMLSVYVLPNNTDITTAGALLDMHKVAMAYGSIVPFESRCMDQIKKDKVSFFVLTPEPLTNFSHIDEPFISALATEAGKNKAGWYRYRVEVLHHPCLASSVGFTREVVRILGGDEEGVIFSTKRIYKSSEKEVI